MHALILLLLLTLVIAAIVNSEEISTHEADLAVRGLLTSVSAATHPKGLSLGSAARLEIPIENIATLRISNIRIAEYHIGQASIQCNNHNSGGGGGGGTAAAGGPEFHQCEISVRQSRAKLTVTINLLGGQQDLTLDIIVPHEISRSVRARLMQHTDGKYHVIFAHEPQNCSPDLKISVGWARGDAAWLANSLFLQKYKDIVKEEVNKLQTMEGFCKNVDKLIRMGAGIIGDDLGKWIEKAQSSKSVAVIFPGFLADKYDVDVATTTTTSDNNNNDPVVVTRAPSLRAFKFMLEHGTITEEHQNNKGNSNSNKDNKKKESLGMVFSLHVTVTGSVQLHGKPTDPATGQVISDAPRLSMRVVAEDLTGVARVVMVEKKGKVSRMSGAGSATVSGPKLTRTGGTALAIEIPKGASNELRENIEKMRNLDDNSNPLNSMLAHVVKSVVDDVILPQANHHLLKFLGSPSSSSNLNINSAQSKEEL